MNDSIIFDALLASAVTENSNRELEALPSEEELRKQYVFSHRFESRMRSLIKKESQRRVLRVLRTVAASFLIILGVAFGVMLISEDVRAAVVRTVVEWFDKFTKFSFSEGTEERTYEQFEISYLPEGFNETETLHAGTSTIVVFSDELGRRIVFEYSPSGEGLVVSLDNEQREYMQVQHLGLTLHVFEADENTKENAVLWETYGNVFSLISPVDLTDLYKIVDGVKPSKNNFK